MLHRHGCLLVLPVVALCVPLLFAQGTSAMATATCNFDANRQIAVEYLRMTVNAKKPVFGREIPYDKVWAPGGRPMTLFVNTPVSLAGHAIPIGAYTVFVIPAEKQWTLILSKSTDTSGKYDEHDDFLRVPMDYGKLPSAEEQFSVYFGHVAPTQCSMRLDLEKSRAWVTFTAK